jgi:MinD-like ATPase involved in chromosome partitioning or flagellar assembly
MKTILATGIPEMNAYIKNYIKFLEITGEDQTKEGCVSFLADNPDTELAVITPFLPGNPREPQDFINGLCGAFVKVKLIAILPPDPPEDFVDYLNSLGVVSLYGDITSDLLIEALTCVVENKAFNLQKPDQIAASLDPFKKTVEEAEEIAEEIAEENKTYETAAEEEPTVDEITAKETTVNADQGLIQKKEIDLSVTVKPLIEYGSLNSYQGGETFEQPDQMNQLNQSVGEDELKIKHQVIAVFAPCHSGTTTLAANISLMLANKIDGVALIDLNTTKPDVKTHYGITHYNNLDSAMTLLAGNNLNSITLTANMVEHNRISVLLGTQNPFTCNFDDSAVKKLIEQARSTFNLTIIDVSGDIGNWGTLAALQAADKIIIVLEQHIACLQYYNQIKSEVFPNYGIDDAKVDIILNRYHEKASLSPGEVKVSIGHELSCVLNETNDVYTSISIGTPLVQNVTTKMGREFVKSLEKYIAKLINGINIQEQPKKRVSLLQRFLRKNAV